jgi:hypothetical protein
VGGLPIPAEPMADVVNCDGCHDLSKPTSTEAINEKCMECHSDEEEKYKGMLRSWKTEIDALFLEAGSVKDGETVERLRTLRKAGPLHNIEAARVITRALLGRTTVAPTGQTSTEE